MTAIRLISHTGELNTVARLHPKSMLVLDANTVLTFTQHIDNRKHLDEKLFRLLRETKQRVRHQWIERSKFIPVDPVLAIMELTQQDSDPNYKKYLERFEHFLYSVYGVENYDRTWVRQTYDAVYRLTYSVHVSLQRTLQKIQASAPTTGILDRPEILKRIDALLEWLISERSNLAVIGGPLIQLAVYAIAGSPEAHRFLKLTRVPKEGSKVVARNVAWDLMHWINLDFHYYYAKYPSTVICTSDQALAEFLLYRKNLAPRIGREEMERTRIVESYGVMSLPKLSRLDNTRLGEDITQRLHAFWNKMEKAHEGEILFTPFQ